MNIVYTRHFLEAMKERPYLSKPMVEIALAYPDEIVLGDKGRLVAHKLIGGKLLRVVFDKNADEFIVWTAYITKPERYSKVVR